MLNIVLYQPEIPPNTGNIMRLCANNGCSLHLIEPLGFDLDTKKLRRAGLDSREFAQVSVYENLLQFQESHPDSRLMGITTKGSKAYHSVKFQPGEALLFGPETRGQPAQVLDQLPDDQRIRSPMLADSRSLNLSNAAAVISYEALRQLGFEGLQ
mgnify:CR=1 FL=1